MSNPKDEYRQDEPDYSGDLCPAPDYTGGSGVNTERRKSGKITREGNTRACARWRARCGGKYRDYMRRYMAARRQKARLVAAGALEIDT